MDVVRACLQAGQSSGIAFTGSPGLGLEKETGLSLLAPLLNRQILLPLLWKTGFSSHGIVSERTVTKLVFLKLKPHERAVFEDGQGRGPTCGSRFGADIITRSIQWAKLGGSVVNLLAMDGSVHKKQEIRSSLGTWWLDAHESLTSILHVESTSATASQIQEMNSGIRGDSSSVVRLSSAREAISTLSCMVSSWSSVYNGAVWQLLYCPFTPFFVIFGNIIYSDGAQTSAIAQDLNLLPATVDYFAHTASVFLQLAQGHVPHHALTETIEKQAKAFQSQPEEHMGRRDQGPKFPVDLHLGEFNVAKYFERLPTEMSPMVYI
ncbi:hypothetical protein HAV15_009667 [Penicillium sp. str. |nr:hypothetical protein HAV15_009667 [Penicillium sp. str. \